MLTQTIPYQVIKPAGGYVSKQAATYFGGISARNTNAQGICMHLITIPPWQCDQVHRHKNQVTTIYVISGKAGMWYSEDLTEHLSLAAGEYLYIPAGVPYLPYNQSETEPLMALVARTDPNEQDSVVSCRN